MDPDILAVFRKSLKRVTASRVSEVELQTLQINLRKYVTRVKDRHKQEQLTRFKENLCSANCLCEHKANGGGNHRQQQQLWERRREEDSIEEQENSRYSHQ
jgi:chorismate synthase